VTDASIAGIRAAMANVNGQIEEAQGVLHDASERLKTAAQMAGSVIEGSDHQAAHAGLAHLTEVVARCSEAIQTLEAAKEEFGTYAGMI
jgi:hypothetical protein